MNKLKSTYIKNKLNEFVDYFEKTINERDLFYEDGLNKEYAIKEINEIKTLLNSIRPFTIAFVGEYSAGKTTIINLLTNMKRTTGTDVSTQKAEKLEWNNIVIIDTPGLGSGFVEHDEITKKWLAEADLIVYIMTTDLYTGTSGERFLDMLDNFKRDNELMLVINQIDRTENPLNVYLEDLQQFIEPRHVDDYYPSFISAKYMEKSGFPNLDDEERDYFYQESHFDEFIEKLNTFIMDKRSKAELTTPLTKLYMLTQKIKFKNTFDKEDSLIDYKISLCKNAEISIKNKTNDLKEHLNDIFIGCKGRIFNLLDSPSNTIKEDLEHSYNEYISNIKKCTESFNDSISLIIDEFKENNIQIDNSVLFKEVRENIEKTKILKEIFNKFDNIHSKSEKIENEDFKDSITEGMNNIKNLDQLDIPVDLKEVSNLLGSQNIFQASATIVGKIDKKIVLDIGHKFAYKFKPWQATKIAGNFAKAVPILNLTAVGYEILSSAKGKYDKNKAERQLRQLKDDIQQQLSEINTNVILASTNTISDPLEKEIKLIRNEWQNKKIALIKFANEDEKICKELENKKQSCIELYDVIYNNKNGK